MADRDGLEGLARVAHAIRRSTALYVAVQITAPESSVDEVLVVADRLAEWVRSDIPTPGQSDPPPAFPTSRR